MNKVYAVYDSKMEAYMSPFFLPTKGAAIRAWEQTVNDPQTQFHKFPADFTLFEIGTYDDQKGELIPHAAKVNLGTALELRKELPVTNADLFNLNARKEASN